ncbi:MAG: hypothetical protein ACFB0B_04575 [Thermonemataceae bacterium]
MIKPLRPLLLCVYVFVALGILMFFLPDEVPLLGEYELRFFNYQNTLLKEKPTYADISGIKDKFDRSKKQPTSKQTTDPQDTTQADTQTFDPSKYETDTVSYKVRIQYSPDHPQALAPFFTYLKSVNQGASDALIRVIHYGDSQLEGDRMTAYLRNRFQERFGGCGGGLQPLTNKLNMKISVTQQNDATWQYHPIFGKGYSRANPNTYGLLANYYRFGKALTATPKAEDSTNLVADFTTWYEAKATYRRSNAAHQKDQRVENIKVLYHNPQAPLRISILEGADTVAQESFSPTSQAGVYQTTLTNAFQQVTVHFKSPANPQIYGVALDCNQGITFDNVPIRGSSGLDFTKMNAAHLQQQMQALKVKMMIVQYGVNVDQNLSDYTFYERGFYNQLKFLKSLAPDMCILVIGTSDRSYNKNGDYVSYPNIEKLRDAQRNAAFKAGCAFWDLYEVMGGKNSMPSWVFNKPPLAEKDFTHFSYRGANIVSEALYEALIYEYEKYLSGYTSTPENM